MNDSLYFIERFCFSVGATLSALVIAFTRQYWEAGEALPTLKEFIVTMTVQAVVNVQSKYGEEAAMKELMGMMTEAAQQYCEATKGDEKCEVLN